MAKLAQKTPALLFFYEMMPGDLLKHQVRSNVAATGGGARDLRPRPSEGFMPVLREMFYQQTKKEGVSQGAIHWYDEEGNVQSVTISLWPPTEARKDEARISTAYKVKAWTVSQEAYAAARQQGQKWFFVLIKDTDNLVWAYILKEDELDKWTQQVRRYVKKRIALAPQGRRPPHVIGSLNFITGEEYP